VNFFTQAELTVKKGQLVHFCSSEKRETVHWYQDFIWKSISPSLSFGGEFYITEVPQLRLLKDANFCLAVCSQNDCPVDFSFPRPRTKTSLPPLRSEHP